MISGIYLRPDLAAKRPTTFDLFATPGGAPLGAEWPAAARFPLNEDSARVADTVLTDLEQSERPLIITGFATLDRLIDFVAGANRCDQIRVVFGTEPFDSRKAEFSLRGRELPREMKEYWLERGISVLLSGKLLVCIERLKAKRLLVRYVSRSKWRLHAKIYVGDQAVTLGSSNFTDSGLRNQLEANVRFQRFDSPTKPAQREEGQRYTEAVQIAEQFWDLSVDLVEVTLRGAAFKRRLQSAASSGRTRRCSIKTALGSVTSRSTESQVSRKGGRSMAREPPKAAGHSA